MSVTLDELINLAKRRAIVFPAGEIYGGLAGFFDYGPIGLNIKRRLVEDWWWYFVDSRDDVYGINPAIIQPPKVWEASGHVEKFIDILVECKKCKSRYKAETLIEDHYKIRLTDYSIDSIAQIITEKNIKCPKCGGDLSEPKKFNLMIEAFVGPVRDESSIVYLRPEIAQGMFINFKLISVAMGAKLPFGIASYGKVFRNEISPRNFLFRAREFEIAEIEYFIDPEKENECPYFSEVENIVVKIWPKDYQKNGREPEEMSILDAYEKGIFSNMWHAYWVGKAVDWLIRIGIKPENLRIREHLETELAHYAKQTFDIEYNFPYFGWKEIVGIANRTDYDLKRHASYSKEKLYITENGRKIYPYCIEPSFGVDRVFMAVLTDAYTKRDGKIVLKLNPKIAPYDVAILILAKKPQFIKKAQEISNILRKERIFLYIDLSGKIGKSYLKADEIGVPFAITIDYQTFEDDSVTIRFRDTREQIRVKISDISKKLRELTL